jgi:hypothetical protein
MVGLVIGRSNARGRVRQGRNGLGQALDGGKECLRPGVCEIPDARSIGMTSAMAADALEMGGVTE